MRTFSRIRSLFFSSQVSLWRTGAVLFYVGEPEVYVAYNAPFTLFSVVNMQYRERSEHCRYMPNTWAFRPGTHVCKVCIRALTQVIIKVALMSILSRKLFG